jgi:hypothetical protein
MNAMMRHVGLAILIIAAATGCGLGQQTAPEKHVKDIRAEQPQDLILASPLCQRARDNHVPLIHSYNVDKSTLEPDLASLMEDSDEVILGGAVDSTDVISPSGEEAIEYVDVIVLQSWKGSHKVGDVLTFAIPAGMVRCTASLASGEPQYWTIPDGGGNLNCGLCILMLRHSRGDETQLTPGLRLTGGDGMQGMYDVNPVGPRYPGPGFVKNCEGYRTSGDIRKGCVAFLKSSQTPVGIRYPADPLAKKYSGMPISKFMQEVESVADSLGYSAQAHAGK